jgi:hypothetical protein
VATGVRSGIKHYSMKTYGGMDVQIHLGTSWRLVVSFTPRPLYLRGKSACYPLDRRLGGPQIRSGRCGVEKILDSAGTRTPIPRLCSPEPVTTPTELSRLCRTRLGILNRVCPNMLQGSHNLCHLSLRQKHNASLFYGRQAELSDLRHKRGSY